MKKKYVEEVAPALMTKFQYESVMQIPKIEKIVVSVGCGDCKDNAIGHLIAAQGLAGHTTALHSAVLHSFRHQH
jgi:ribosomal protein L5